MKNTTKTHALSLAERIVFPQILPPTGSYVTKIVHKELLAKVEIKSADIEKYEIVFDGGLLKTNKEGSISAFDFGFSPIELTEIANGLKAMDARATLQNQHISLYEKFILNK